MILADALGITINLLLVAHVVISLLLILVILMQRPKQEGLGAAFGGGVTDQMFGAQTTNVLQKGTVYLGSAFLILSLVLAILIGNQNYTAAMDNPTGDTVEEAPAVPDPEVVPDEESGSIMEDLGGESGGTPEEGDVAPPPDATDTTVPEEDDATPTPTEDEPDDGGTTPPNGTSSPVPDDGGTSESSETSEGNETGGGAASGSTPSGEPEEDKPE